MLEFHHIGCIVEDIDESVALQLQIHHGAVSPKYHLSSQQVIVCFVELSPGNFLEFVQPSGPDSAVNGLKKKNITYYHLGYKVYDFDKSISELESQGYKSLNVFNSEAFDGKRCAFLFGPDLRLIELIEK